MLVSLPGRTESRLTNVHCCAYEGDFYTSVVFDELSETVMDEAVVIMVRGYKVLSHFIIIRLLDY